MHLKFHMAFGHEGIVLGGCIFFLVCQFVILISCINYEKNSLLIRTNGSNTRVDLFHPLYVGFVFKINQTFGLPKTIIHHLQFVIPPCR